MAPRVLRPRSTAAIIAGLTALAAAAWAGLVWESVAMAGMSASGMSAMTGPDTSPWSPAQVLSLFLMWAVMMAAMMLPGAAPAVLVMQRLATARRQAGRSGAEPWWFVVGYLGAWCGFSLAATVLQSTLHATMAMSTAMVLTHPLAAAALLAAVGAYQLSTLKGRCLVHCRSPLEFLMLHWRQGRVGALLMGARHGSWCVGCCWLLMAVLFVVGVMNLAWILALTVLVFAEKSLPNGHGLARGVGWLLLGWAAWRAIAWWLMISSP